MVTSVIDFSQFCHVRDRLHDEILTNMESDIDAKERADRMAAAEAMSALSMTIPVNQGISPGSPRASKRIATKRSKSTEQGLKVSENDAASGKERKKSRSYKQTNHDQTGVTAEDKNKPKRVTSKTKVTATAQPKTKRSPRKKKTSVPEQETVSKSRHRSKSHNSDTNETGTGDSPVLISGQLPSLQSGLPFPLPSLNLPSLGTLPTLPTLGSLSLFSVHEEKVAKKQDNKSLPFKKRRLVNDQDDDKEDSDERQEGRTTQELTSQTPSGLLQLQLDPTQQFRLFGEIQAALTADEDGDIPLHLAVVHEHLPLVNKFIKLMKIAKKSVDRFNKDKQTPLHLAVKLEFLPGVQALLHAGADINYVDKTGCSSLHLAVKHQLPICLQLLVNKSHGTADFNTRNFEGLSPLHTAVELRSVDLVTFILDHGSDINIMDGKSGRTALFHAAENNQENIVELLLKRGANPDILNYAGSTAIMAAQARNFNIITKMLSGASELNDDDRSLNASPASEVSVYVPSKSIVPAAWKQVMPVYSEAMEQTSSSSAEAFQKNKTKNLQNEFIPRTPATSTRPQQTSEMMSRSVDQTSRSLEQMSRSLEQTARSLEQTSRSVEQTSEISGPLKSLSLSDKRKASRGSNSSRGDNPVDRAETENQQQNVGIQNLKFSDLHKLPPEVAQNIVRKILEAKQKQFIEMQQAARQKQQEASAKQIPKPDHKGLEPNRVESAVPQKTTSPSNKPVHSPVVAEEAMSDQNSMSRKHATLHNILTAKPDGLRPASSRSVSPDSVTTSSSNSTDLTQKTPTAFPPETQVMDPSVFRIVPVSSQALGKICHVVQKVSNNEESIVSTGMCVQHPEYGLVFRPFGSTATQTLGLVEAKPSSSESMDVDSDGSVELMTSSVENTLGKTASKPDTLDSDSRKPDSPVLQKNPVRSHPVTEKLLNAKPKPAAIPKQKMETSAENRTEHGIKSIANSAIAAKLRHRVLNAPHVDSNTKVGGSPAAHSQGVVSAVPERVPKLPQFGTASTNSISSVSSTSTSPILSPDSPKLYIDEGEASTSKKLLEQNHTNIEARSTDDENNITHEPPNS